MTRSMRGVWTAVVLTLAAGVLRAIPMAQATHGAQQVVVDNFSFAPGAITVPVGTTVTWTNHDDIPHNVVNPERKFKSPVLDTDEQFSHTFDVAGTYKYYCSIHPRMTGEVVVR
jgi:plastocyanin